VKALVIGGGIGGLAAAIALAKAGVEALVYERARAFQEVGAGISIWANAMHALGEFGLADAVRARIRFLRYSDVRTPGGAILSASASEERVGVMHRADLLSIFVGALEGEYSEASRLHLDHECVGFSQDAAGVTAQFSDGTASRGDVLIGADGLDSVVRGALFGKSAPRYAGYTAWRSIASLEASDVAACEMWGRGRRFGIVPMRDNRIYWYATSNALEGERDSPGQTKQHLLHLFRGWQRPVEQLIAASAEPAILQNDIYDRPPLARWSENRVTLLGDAAHPMTPNLGQGGCQAIEDAVVLAACLRGSSDVASALREYQGRRISRTSKIVLASRRIGNIAQWSHPALCFLRNTAVRATPPSVARRQIASVVDYDVLTARERSEATAARSD
jgi:2-polyprenyl-6-methoxyphenol hydroxylase-like FAD-dependent oxidoreductase